MQARKLKRQEEQEISQAQEIELKEIEAQYDEIEQALYFDMLEIELGYSLVSLADSKEFGDLVARIDLIKKQITRETGFIVPAIRVRDNIQLSDNAYKIKIKGIEVAEGYLYTDRIMILNPDGDGFDIEGFDTKEPVFNLEARWIQTKDKNLAEEKNYTVIDPITLLVTHVSEIIKDYAYEILGIADVQNLLDKLTKHNAVVVKEVIPKKLELSELHVILKNLLRERIPIKDLATILEALLIRSKTTKNTDILTEYVRQSLARSITNIYQNPPGVISAIVVDPDIEQVILNSLKQDEHNVRSVLNPEIVNQIIEKIGQATSAVSAKGFTPIILCLSPIRPHMRQMAERVKSNIVVLSYEEITEDVKIEPVGIVRLNKTQ